MAGFNLAVFKKEGLRYGGARPSLFHVELFTPGAVGSQETLKKFTFTCRASQIPASTIESVDVPYFGRKIKLVGDRTFADWPVTVMNDEDFVVRNMFEDWSNQMNTHAGNKQLLVDTEYKSTDAIVTQFTKEGKAIKKYRFVGIFPTTIDPIQLDWDQTNSVETFDVTFAYDYWEPLDGADNPTLDIGESDTNE